MSKNEYPSICILDCYFELLDDDFAYYKISDEELSKLIVKIREIEFERDSIKNVWRRYKKVYDEEIKKLKHEKHVYKVELKRCVRKLTRIYKETYLACLFDVRRSGYNLKYAKEAVKLLKGL